MPDTPQVKVEITADDGNATEAVRALAAQIVDLGRKTAAAGGNLERAGQSARRGAEGFTFMRGAVEALKPLLAGLTVAALAFKLEHAIQDALDFGEALYKLQQRTGGTAEGLSVLSVAAEGVGLAQEDMSTGLTRL